MNDKATSKKASSKKVVSEEQPKVEDKPTKMILRSYPLSAMKAAPLAHEIEDASDWAKAYWDKFSPAQHKGLSQSSMTDRLAALGEYMSKEPHNPNLQRHIRRLNHLINKA